MFEGASVLQGLCNGSRHQLTGQRCPVTPVSAYSGSATELPQHHPKDPCKSSSGTLTAMFTQFDRVIYYP
jgi:hypothetical protein